MKNKFSRKSLLLVSMTVVLATVINLFAGVVAFADDATTTDVIEIESAEELEKIGNDAAYPASGNYKLVTNLSLSGEWTPLPAFSGTFDGNGHTISGLSFTIENDTDDAAFGMFLKVTGTGEVKNLTLTDVDIDVTATNRTSVGAIAGATADTAKIYNCKVSGKIEVKYTAGKSTNARIRVGGILGFANSDVKYCESNVEITVRTNYTATDDSNYKNACYAGGIVGQGLGTVAYCVNNGTVKATATAAGPAYAGGICGTNVTWVGAAVTLESCVNNGKISATNGAAGILACISKDMTATLKNNFNFGTVTSDGYAGQILGQNNKDSASTYAGNYGLENNGNLGGNVDNAVVGATDTKENMLINQPTLGTQVVGYQTSEAKEGYFNLRLVATMEGGYKNLTNVGFTVSASYGNVTKDEQTFTIKTLYSSISAEANTKAEKEYTAKDLGGDYIFVLACKNLPENVGYITFTVTTFYTDANGTHSNMVQTFTVNSDDIPSANMPEAAA